MPPAAYVKACANDCVFAQILREYAHIQSQTKRDIAMFDYERHSAITEMLHSCGSLTTREIADKLFVSEATVRRDLTKLEHAGLVRRTHGGVMLIAGPAHEIPLTLRERANDTAKQNIAAKAVRLISDGDTIMLDASSTVFRLVARLAAFKNITVITNGPKATLELASLHIKTLCTGGIVLENSLAFVGRQAEEFIDGINADVAFLSCRGISPDGYLTDSSLEEASIRRVMLRRAKRRVLLCDTTKFDMGYTYNIARLDELDEVISEK